MCPKSILAPAQRADPPARFLDQERTGRSIPGLESELPEAIHPPGCDISQIQCRRSGPADACGLARERAQHRVVSVGVAFLVSERKAGRKQHAIERALFADAHAPILEVRAGAARGSEDLLP